MLDLLVTLLILIIIFSVIVYILQTFIPMDPRLRNLVMLILGVILLIWIILALAGTAPLFPLRGHRLS